MRILLLTPGINQKYNDNYFAYKYMTENEHDCEILAISNRSNFTKTGAQDISECYENDSDLRIFRIFDNLQSQNNYWFTRRFKSAIRQEIDKFDPDIIFCENTSNLSLAVNIKRKLKIPIILRMEMVYSKNRPYGVIGKQRFIKNPVAGDTLGIILGRLIWQWCCRHADAIITCYYDDIRLKNTNELAHKPFYFVPWPTHQTFLPEGIKKNMGHGVFIGAFDRHKNVREFTLTVPKLLDCNRCREFVFVGMGRDIWCIERLVKQYPGKIRHIPFMSRAQCLELIAGSFFAYSPATSGGWGFIGDAWAMKTPLIVTCNHYDFHDNMDAIVANPGNIDVRLAELYDKEGLYEKVVQGGFERFQKYHRVDAVGFSYYDICRRVLKDK